MVLHVPSLLDRMGGGAFELLRVAFSLGRMRVDRLRVGGVPREQPFQARRLGRVVSGLTQIGDIFAKGCFSKKRDLAK